jgi:hypothetical protein
LLLEKKEYLINPKELNDCYRISSSTIAGLKEKEECIFAAQYVPLCNNCFWCKERDWGIKNAK